MVLRMSTKVVMFFDGSLDQEFLEVSQEMDLAGKITFPLCTNAVIYSNAASVYI